MWFFTSPLGRAVPRAPFRPDRAAALALALANPLFCAAQDQSSTEESKPDGAPVQQLGTISVTGRRASSLPGQLPASMHSITREQLQTQTLATDSADALKYFPSLNVRKRYIGDYDHAVLASRASGTSNSARSLVFVDGIALANLLGNGAAYTPRWGLVAPQEIERVDVLYGPYSAAYSGNAMGAVVDMVTRVPERFEAEATLGAFGQRFDQYGGSGHFGGQQFQAHWAGRSPTLWWRASVTRLSSEGMPLVWANRLQSAGSTMGAAAAPVAEGAVLEPNPRGQPWWILGESNTAQTEQTQAKWRIGLDVSPRIRASAQLALWHNRVGREAQSYLRHASGPLQGQPIESGDVNLGGLRYTLAAGDFALRRERQLHALAGFTLESRRADAAASGAPGGLEWRLSASRVGYVQDDVRTSASALPAARAGGAGTLTRMDGTGWATWAARATWRAASHTLDVGVSEERYALAQTRETLTDWQRAETGPVAARSAGRSQLRSAYLQHHARLGAMLSPSLERWRTTVGVRHETWHTKEGLAQASGPAVRYAERSASAWSPKLSVAYALTDEWQLSWASGRAVRWPTVAELYQSTGSLGQTLGNDPALRPERGLSNELTFQRDVANDAGQPLAQFRATGFFERVEDALISQLNPATNASNVQNVPRTRTRGLELALQAKNLAHPRLGRWSLTSSLTYADSRVVKNPALPASEGKRQPRVPDWRATLAATWHASERVRATLGWRYSGRQYGQLDNSDTNEEAYQSVSRYSVVDLRVRAQLSPHWALAAGIDNLTNRRYWAFHAYPSRTFNAELSWKN